MYDSRDFVVSYPCFIPAQDPGNFVTIRAARRRCLVLLTDDDLLERFYMERHAGFDEIQVTVLQCDCSEELVNTLRDLEIAADRQGVRHLAIDPTTDKYPAVTTIREFIEHVEMTSY